MNTSFDKIISQNLVILVISAGNDDKVPLISSK